MIEQLERRQLLSATLVRDFNTLTVDADARYVTSAGGRLFFTATDPDLGSELWTSDGTEAGTVVLKDIVPGKGGSAPKFITAVGSRVFFTTTAGGLWVSDGTSAGTVQVHASATPDYEPAIRDVGGRLYFSANTAGFGSELWVSDGTPAGTRMVKDINPGAAGSAPRGFVDAGNGQIYFGAITAAQGFELWRTDGTAAGTTLVLDVQPGSADGLRTDYASGLLNLAVLNGSVYFRADDGAAGGGPALWRSDGTAGGTVKVIDADPASDAASGPSSLRKVGANTLYFGGKNAAGRAQLFRSNGTAAGTWAVTNWSAASDPTTTGAIYDLGGRAVFWASNRLYASDGTGVGTVPLTATADVVGQDYAAPTYAGGRLVLVAGGYNESKRFYSTDGTPAGTRLIAAATISYGYPVSLAVLNGQIYYGGYGAQGVGIEVQRADPVTGAVTCLKDIGAAAPYGSDVHFFRSAGQYVYFLVRGEGGGDYGYGNFVLWRTDGTDAGTVRLFDTGYNPYNGGLGQWDAVAYDGTSLVFKMGAKIWLSGPEPGTQRLLTDGQVDSFLSPPVVTDDRIYFAANDPTAPYQARLYVSDGTTTRPVATVTNGGLSISGYTSLAAVGDVMYFAGTDASGDSELWRSDGTDAGTWRVKDIRPGSTGSFPVSLIDVGGTLYFRARDGTDSIARLYKSDGTADGTVPAAPALRPAGSGGPEGMPPMVAIGQTLYLLASSEDRPGNTELWRTDGTPAGTVQVTEIGPGSTGATYHDLIAAGGRLFFVANGNLFVSDGTLAGTRQLSNQLAASADNSPVTGGYYGPLRLTATAAGDRVYFAASDGTRGITLWTSDGTPEGTVTVADVKPGGGGLNLFDSAAYVNRTSELAVLGDGGVVFGANDGRGVELWRARADGPVADAGGNPGAAYAAAEGQQVTLSAAGSRPAPGGSPIVKYEWDLDYSYNFQVGGINGFDVDVVGATATYTGRDGPGVGHVAVRITDAAGNVRFDTASVTVTDTPPVVTASGPAAALAGRPYVLSLFAGDDPGPDVVRSWRIDWGDGTVDVLQGNPTSATHTYAATGEYAIYATANDGFTQTAGRRTVGLLDPNFAAGGVLADAGARADRRLALLPDGRIVSAGGDGAVALARYAAEGRPDLSFGPGGTGHATTDLSGLLGGGVETVRAMVVDSGGTILVAGTVWRSADDVDWFAARFLAGGALDPSFGDGGVASFDGGPGASADVADVAVDAAGRILLAGTMDQGSGAGGLNFVVRRLTGAGRIDPTFGAGGVAAASSTATDRAAALALQPDGRIVVAGTTVGLSTTAPDAGRFALARFTADGALDTTFGTAGTSAPGMSFLFAFAAEATDLAIQPDGKIVVVGGGSNSSSLDDVVARYLPNGSLDTSFATGAGNGGGVWSNIYYDGKLSAVALAPDGRIVAVGQKFASPTVIRLTATGGLDGYFGDPRANILGAGSVNLQSPLGATSVGRGDILVRPDGNIVVLDAAADGTVLWQLVGESPAWHVSVAPAGSVAGTLWQDANGDGARGAGEPGLAGRTVWVDADGDGLLDNGEPSAVTAADGTYSIGGLLPGSYPLRQVLPADWVQTAPAGGAARVVALAPGQNATGADFGSRPRPGTVAGVLYNDADADGTRDAGEQGLGGRTVWADLDDDAVLDAGEPSAVTAADGRYALDLAPGGYVIRQLLPAGWLQSDPGGAVGATAGRAVNLAAGQTAAGTDFGSVAAASLGRIAGSVFDDANADGVLQAGAENASVSGRVVWLDADNDGLLDAGERSFTTQADGYVFDRLPAGTYVVRAVVPQGLRQTAPAGGAPLVVTLGAGQSMSNQNFGIAPPPAPAEVALRAAADAYVRDGSSAATNFGAATQLQVKQAGGSPGNTRETYLRFDLSQVGPGITSVVLRLYGSLSAAGESVVVGAYACADVAWGEGAITWNTKPAAGAGPVATATLLGTGAQWYEWDVTDYLSQQRAAGAAAATVVLRGTAISGAVANFNSDEAADAATRPQLVVRSQPADVTPPAVAGASVAGSAWSAAFGAALGPAVLGDASTGVWLSLNGAPTAAAGLPLPWANLDRIRIRFSEAVTGLEAADLKVRGSSVANYATTPPGFSYDPATFTATWALAQPLAGADRLVLELPAGAATDLAGNPLAAWSLQFNVLPGDADRNGRVDAFDTLAVKAKQGSNAATAPANYSVFHDVDGNGRIDAFDTLGVKARQGTNLNQVPVPTAATLFGTDPIVPAGGADGAGGDNELAALLG